MRRLMKLLFVDDEPRIQELVQRGLSDDAFEVDVCSTAEKAISKVREATVSYDGFLLDIALPGTSGIDLCRWLRQSGNKGIVIMLTALGSVDDKVAGLEAGADDYLVKPFEIAELRARFRAGLRKSQGYPREPLSVSDLVFDPNTRNVTRAGTEIALSKKEAQLLEYLLKNQGRLVTRAMIANAVWETDTNQYTNVIDVFVTRLRKKIDVPNQPQLLHTVRGKGFLLTASREIED